MAFRGEGLREPSRDLVVAYEERIYTVDREELGPEGLSDGLKGRRLARAMMQARKSSANQRRSRWKL